MKEGYWRRESVLVVLERGPLGWTRWVSEDDQQSQPVTDRTLRVSSHQIPRVLHLSPILTKPWRKMQI